MRGWVGWLVVVALGLSPVAGAPSLAQVDQAPELPQPAVSGDSEALALYQSSLAARPDYTAERLSVSLPVGGAATVRVVQVGGLTLTEYIFPAELAEVRLLTDGQRWWAEGPARRLSLHQLLGHQIVPDPELIAQNYQVELTGPEPYLGRPAQVVTFWQLGHHSTRVWIDQETHLELRREVYNHTGTLVEVREFVALTYQVSEADRALVARLSASPPLVDQSLRFFTLAEASATSGLALRLPAQLPHGFRFVGVMQPEGNLAHLVFTDGLHTMSLYEERVPWWAFWAWPAPPTLISQQRISHRMRFTLVCNLGAHQMRVLLDSLP